MRTYSSRLLLSVFFSGRAAPRPLLFSRVHAGCTGVAFESEIARPGVLCALCVFRGLSLTRFAGFPVNIDIFLAILESLSCGGFSETGESNIYYLVASRRNYSHELQSIVD